MNTTLECPAESVQSLTAKLAVAKRAAVQSANDAMLNEFRTKLCGHAFAWRHVGRANARSVGFTLYGRKAELDTWSQPEEMKVKYSSRSVSVSIDPSKRAFEPARISCGSREDTGDSVARLLSETLHEIDPATFETLWVDAKGLTGNLLGTFAALAGTELTTAAPYRSPNAEELPALDCPHLVLPHDEANLVSGPFLVCDTIYLLTPNSRAYAARKLAEGESADARCSHLYETCDMAYVTRKRASIASLRARLAIGA
jgi:hypothetical protein